MAREGLGVREVSEVEGNRLLRIVRRSSGSVVTWRRTGMVRGGVADGRIGIDGNVYSPKQLPILSDTTFITQE